MKFIFIFKLLITVKHQKNIYKMNTIQYPNKELSQNQYREERYNRNDHHQRTHQDRYREERYNRNDQHSHQDGYREERHNRNDQHQHPRRNHHHEEECYRNEQKMLEEKRVIRELRKKEYEDLDPETRERYEEVDRHMEMFNSPNRKLLKGEFILTFEQRQKLFNNV